MYLQLLQNIGIQGAAPPGAAEAAPAALAAESSFLHLLSEAFSAMHRVAAPSAIPVDSVQEDPLETREHVPEDHVPEDGSMAAAVEDAAPAETVAVVTAALTAPVVAHPQDVAAPSGGVAADSMPKTAAVTPEAAPDTPVSRFSPVETRSSVAASGGTPPSEAKGVNLEPPGSMGVLRAEAKVPPAGKTSDGKAAEPPTLPSSPMPGEKGPAALPNPSPASTVATAAKPETPLPSGSLVGSGPPGDTSPEQAPHRAASPSGSPAVSETATAPPVRAERVPQGERPVVVVVEAPSTEAKPKAEAVALPKPDGVAPWRPAADTPSWRKAAVEAGWPEVARDSATLVSADRRVLSPRRLTPSAALKGSAGTPEGASAALRGSGDGAEIGNGNMVAKPPPSPTLPAATVAAASPSMGGSSPTALHALGLPPAEMVEVMKAAVNVPLVVRSPRMANSLTPESAPGSAPASTEPVNPMVVEDGAPAKAKAPPVKAEVSPVKSALNTVAAAMEDGAAPMDNGAKGRSTDNAAWAWEPKAKETHTAPPETRAVGHARGESATAAVSAPVRSDAPAPPGSQGVTAETLPREVAAQPLQESMVRGVRLLLSKGEQTLTVRMVPESLGEVRLEVRAHADGVRIRIDSANPAVRQALEQQLPALREALLREGIEAGRLEVGSSSHASTGSGNPGGHPPGQHGAGRAPEGYLHANASQSGEPGNSNPSNGNPSGSHARKPLPADEAYRSPTGMHGGPTRGFSAHQGSMNLLV